MYGCKFLVQAVSLSCADVEGLPSQSRDWCTECVGPQQEGTAVVLHARWGHGGTGWRKFVACGICEIMSFHLDSAQHR